MNEVAKQYNARRIALFVTLAMSLPALVSAGYAVFSLWVVLAYGPEATVFFPTRRAGDDEIPALVGAIAGFVFAGMSAYVLRVIRRRLLSAADAGGTSPHGRIR